MSDSVANGRRPFLPPRWIIRAAWKIHRAIYRMSGGRKGLRRPSEKTYGLMRLTVPGRRSGQDRSVILAYFNDGDDLVTMAMNGWAAPEPAWWLNLQASPEAEVRLVDGISLVSARRAEGSERDRLWSRWQELDKNLDGYAARRPAETAVVVLEPWAATTES